MIPQNFTDRFHTDLKHGEILAGPFSSHFTFLFIFFSLLLFLVVSPLTLGAGTGKPQSDWLFKWLGTEDQVGSISFVSFSRDGDRFRLSVILTFLLVFFLASFSSQGLPVAVTCRFITSEW